MPIFRLLASCTLESELETIQRLAALLPGPWFLDFESIFGNVRVKLRQGENTESLKLRFHEEVERKRQQQARKVAAQQRAVDSLIVNLTSMDFSNLDDLVLWWQKLWYPLTYPDVTLPGSTVTEIFGREGFVPNFVASAGFEALALSAHRTLSARKRQWPHEPAPTLAQMWPDISNPANHNLVGRQIIGWCLYQIQSGAADAEFPPSLSLSSDLHNFARAWRN